MAVAVIAFIVFMERAQRRLLIQYPKRQVGNRMFEGQSSHLPLKLNTSGVIPPIFAAAAADWPGTIDRDERWWQHLWHDPKEDRGGRTGLLFAVHATAGTDGTDDGYAVYRTRLSWGTGADSELSLEELVSGSVIAYTALWRFLLDVDLMPRLVAYRRPVDEPLRWMLAERRLVRTRIDEALWLRLVDVAAALAARRYSAEGSVVIEVVDAFCPWNAGTLELDVGPDGARCRPTSKAADLTATAADLAAVYLGGVSVATLARAGRILEQAAGAGARADELFRWSRAPWCDRLF
jgi:predicted acetyltransferase